MKYCRIYIIATYSITLLWLQCSSQEITAEDFTWKLIENSLNCTKSTENFVIAPHQAYQLFKELFLNDDERNDAQESPENVEQKEEQLLSTVLPAIRKQIRILNTKKDNHTDLLSSVSLTARWSFNFQTRDTHKKIFHQLGKHNQKIWVDFLRKDDTFYYMHNDQLNVSILELPLNVKDIKLTIILPDQWESLPELRDYLVENIQEFTDLIQNRTQKMILVRILLPKFHLSYKKDLSEFMKQISSKELDSYDHVYQLSNLEFNERGIGRFERTTVLFWNAYSYLRVSPEIFDISHPFLFFISDKDGIQFFGQVVKMQH